MLNFFRLFFSAACITCLFLEITLGIKIVFSVLLLQSWLLSEWLAMKNKKEIAYDVLLHDILPFMAQIIVFYKSVFLS